MDTLEMRTPFAKLFGKDADQILILIEEGESGPEISTLFQPPGLGVCKIKLLGFIAGEAGWELAQQAFERINESKARSWVAMLVTELNPGMASPEDNAGEK